MNSNITDDDLNRTLIESGEIIPSSGFVASVMDAVQEEASAPAPIPFPWKWALPGLVVSVGLIAFFLFQFAQDGMRVSYSAVARLRPLDIAAMLPQGTDGASLLLAGEWSAAALLISFLAIWFSVRVGRE
ncbi:MAG: hypothetical protein WA708_11575 [Acidobacteriaceae bacterium]